MTGLLIKDILNLRKYAMTMLIFIVFYSALSFTMDDPGFISGAIVLFFTMISITSFSYDNLAKWDNYALSLPITRKEMVLSKYILAMLLAIGGTLFSIVAGGLIVFIKDITSFKEQLVISYCLFVIATLFISALLPLIYKYGVEKARIMIVVVIGLPSILLFALSKIGVLMPTDEQFMLLLKLSPIFLVIVLFVSYFISLEIYKKKEL
ncbi:MULTISPECIES: ABC-2 transporter permease [Bacillus]|uniref:ABC-2 transporter permease n=1 Tax=Bacillus TaxID=1386 RepID=UPI0002D5F529|nr:MULTISPECIES: ABC-2 transporter permease [Bacillus]